MFNPIGNSPKSDKSNSRSNSVTSINSLKSNSSDDSELAGLYQNMEEMTFNSDGAVRPTPEPSGRNINPKEMKKSIKINREIGNKRGRDPSPDESLGSMEELNINSDNSISDNSTLPSSPDVIDQEYNDILSVLTETHFLPTENEDSSVHFDAWIETINSEEFIEGVEDNNLIRVAITYLKDDKKMYERTLEQPGLSDEIKHKLQDRIKKINATLVEYEKIGEKLSRKRIKRGGKRKTKKRNKFKAGDQEKYTFDEMKNYSYLLGKYFKLVFEPVIDEQQEVQLGKFISFQEDRYTLKFQKDIEGQYVTIPYHDQFRFQIVPPSSTKIRAGTGNQEVVIGKIYEYDDIKQNPDTFSNYIFLYKEKEGRNIHDWKYLGIFQELFYHRSPESTNLSVALSFKQKTDSGLNFNKSIVDAFGDSYLFRVIGYQNPSTIRETIRAGGKRKTKKQFLFNPNDPKKSFDVYIDKNPKDTIPIKYTTVKDVEDTIKKLERLYKQGKYSHKRIWQVGMILKVRLAAMKKNQKKYYPKAKNVTKRLRLSEKYFKFLKKRTKEKDNKTRKNMKFKF